MPSDLANVGWLELLRWLIRLRRRMKVINNSMLPLLQPGDEVLVDPRAYCCTLPQPGEIVVAQHPLRTDLQIIKRVRAIDDSNRIVLSSDNPAAGADSRTFGPVSVDHILGKVTSRFE